MDPHIFAVAEEAFKRMSRYECAVFPRHIMRQFLVHVTLHCMIQIHLI